MIIGAGIALAGVVTLVIVLAGSDQAPRPGPVGPNGEGRNDPHATPTPAPSPTSLLESAPPGEAGTYPNELMYRESDEGMTRLHRFDLRTGDDEVVLEVPASQIVLPPKGDYLAYVSLGTSSGEETAPDGNTGTPVLHIRHIETGEEEVFEGLAAPEWSWDGERLFAVQADAPPPALATISVTEMEVRPLDLPPAIEWTPIGWADDSLMLFRRPSEGLFLASADGTLTPVPTPDGVVRDPAPSGEYAFATSREGDIAVFQPLDGRAPTSIDLGEWIMGALAPWSGNDRVFSSVASGFEIKSPSVVIVLDPEGASWEVPNTDGSVRAFPTPEGDGFVLLRGKTGVHRAWACLPNGDCRKAPGTIPLGATLLRVG